ncbi:MULTISPECIES: hypothetical protein [unclassified Anoxybacillus]|uniref:hypothetical protein n=1 Tax=unclassified Anoxybacillus TaxID=2639704 RepID=UPI001EDA892C|nr:MULTISPECIES: hypothetical protein [unclassified Anoxybacillus]MCG3083930.1 hypothetical protein [Anoxybacillus sp. LAT27]MCG5025563.1 hypothetical protein [Anoxybacillus flavithermus]
MGEIRKTYDVKFKKKAVDLYLKEGMGYETVAKELANSAWHCSISIIGYPITIFPFIKNDRASTHGLFSTLYYLCVAS